MNTPPIVSRPRERGVNDLHVSLSRSHPGWRLPSPQFHPGSRNWGDSCRNRVHVLRDNWHLVLPPTNRISLVSSFSRPAFSVQASQGPFVFMSKGSTIFPAEPERVKPARFPSVIVKNLTAWITSDFPFAVTHSEPRRRTASSRSPAETSRQWFRRSRLPVHDDGATPAQRVSPHRHRHSPSGFTELEGSLPKTERMTSVTFGILVMPPTSRNSLISSFFRPTSLVQASQGSSSS